LNVGCTKTLSGDHAIGVASRMLLLKPNIMSSSANSIVHM
jgi:hypothetical protein